MRQTHLFLLTGTVLLLAWNHCQADDPVEAVLKKAIDAHGGRDALGRLQKVRVKLKLKINASPDQKLTGTGDAVFDLSFPARFKSTAVCTDDSKQEYREVMVFSDKGAWSKVNAMPAQRIDGDGRFLLMAALQVKRLETLLPLLEFQTKPTVIGEEKVDGKPAVGLCFKSGIFDNGQSAPFEAFFDKQSGLLVKTRFSAPNLFTGKHDVHEHEFSDFKKIGAGMYKSKEVHRQEGKTTFQYEYTDVKLLDKVDDREFAKLK